MSALAGIWRRDARPDAADGCRRMLAAQRPYGPDASDWWDGGYVALGRNLFRTVPEDAFDAQPLSGAGGRFTLVADVRLDNRDELAAALGIAAERAAAMSDAELMLAAWERWETAVFDRILGDYAFAVWDARDRRLVLARDPIGNRPLHYHLGGGFVAFASMPKGLHALPEVPYAPDEERVTELIALLPEWGPASFFAGIRRVEPACFVTIDVEGRDASTRHWAPTRATLPVWSGGDPVEALRAELDRAVRVRLRGAGSNVAAQLSAGMDSGAVASTAARLMAEQGGRVTALTSVPREGYDGPDPRNRFGDEGPLAAETAALHANIDHLLIRPRPGGTPLDWLDEAFFLFDRPVPNLCNFRWVAEIAAEAQARGHRVMLTGQMGNATISYDGLQRFPELLAAGRYGTLFREMRALVKARRGYRWRGLSALTFGPWLPESGWRLLQKLRAGGQSLDMSNYMALRASRAEELDIAGRARARRLDLSYRPRRNGFETRLWMIGRVDPGNPNKGLVAGWKIDSRDPTGDRRLLEFCLALPMEHFAGKGMTRRLAREALADRLPQGVLHGRRKGIQAVDWHEGIAPFRERYAEQVAAIREVEVAARPLDVERMQRWIDEWPNGDEWHSPVAMQRYRLALTRGIGIGHFLRRASGSNR